MDLKDFWRTFWANVWRILDFAEFCWILLVFGGFCWVLWEFSGFLVILVFAGF